MDESQPLLRQITGPREPTVDHPQVEFDPSGDPDNPLDWPHAYKMAVVSLLALMAFTVTFTCVGIVPVASQIVHDLDTDGTDSRSASILLVTVWELGEACGPLLIAPLSEIYGRHPAFNIANVVFILGCALAALSRTPGLFIFARFLTGFAVASNVLNPAVIGDIFAPDQRGSGMSLVMLAPLVGGAVGSAVSGAIAESFGWRTILWMSVVIAVICETFFLVFFQETYKVPILQRRAARLRKETNDPSLKCAWEEERAASALYWSTLRSSVQRPVLMMWDSSVLQIMSFYGATMFTFYYIMATTVPGILAEVYHFSPAQIGYSFLAFSLGAGVGIVICSFFLDPLYIMLGKSHGETSQPEYRLPLLIAGAIFMPSAVALYGWIPFSQWPVYLLLLTFALLGCLILMIMVSLSAYLVDTFGLYSASAMTGVLVTRCLASTLLPLAIPPLIDALGLGYGFLVVAGIYLVLLPLPVGVMRYGSLWRQKSVYTRND